MEELLPRQNEYTWASICRWANQNKLSLIGTTRMKMASELALLDWAAIELPDESELGHLIDAGQSTLRFKDVSAGKPQLLLVDWQVAAYSCLSPHRSQGLWPFWASVDKSRFLGLVGTAVNPDSGSRARVKFRFSEWLVQFATPSSCWLRTSHHAYLLGHFGHLLLVDRPEWMRLSPPLPPPPPSPAPPPP